MSRAAVLLLLSISTAYSASFEQSIYVWQQQWQPEVAEAVARMDDVTAAYMVLAATVTAGTDGAIRSKAVAVNWDAFKAGRRICPVLRADATFARAVKAHSREQTAERIAEQFHHVLTAARRAGVSVSGLQIDYDCPTRKLADYRAFLTALQAALPGVDLSITTLPTWLDSRQFKGLVSDLDYFVLQVHSLEKPTTLEAPLRLYDLAAFPQYFRKAAKTGTPFQIALPTYGYHVVYDQSGEFYGLQAEGPAVAKPGFSERLIIADPVEMAAVVQQLKAEPPRNCRGIAWFRLPVDSDSLNWSWHSLRAVMNGRRPDIGVTANVVESRAGLYDIRVENSGQQNVIGGRVEIDLDWPQRGVLASDTVGSYTLSRADGRTMLRGPLPALDEPRSVAWLRVVGTDVPSVVSARVKK